jgi:SAM-dependent methyltransferase
LNHYNLKEVKDFYNNRHKEVGDTLKSVGWSTKESQYLRFEVLIRNLELENKTILDIGCGLGDFITFLEEKGIKNFNYIGLDISESLIESAKNKFKDKKNIQFIVGDTLELIHRLPSFDISVMSGALSYKIEDNMGYTKEVMYQLAMKSNEVVAFNFLTSYVDYTLEKNFHYKPEEVFSMAKSICKKVNLYHDYPLYEFTVQLFK